MTIKKRHGVTLEADTLDGLDSLAFLKADGTVQLTGDMVVTAGKKMDGVDVSVHDAATTGVHGVGAGTIATTAQALTMFFSNFQYSQDFGATRYIPFQGADTSGGETAPQARCGKAGTLKRLRVNVDSNTLNGAATWTVRINGENTAVTISIGAGSTGVKTDDVNMVAVAIDDLVNYVCVTGGSSGTIGIRGYSIELA